MGGGRTEGGSWEGGRSEERYELKAGAESVHPQQSCGVSHTFHKSPRDPTELGLCTPQAHMCAHTHTAQPTPPQQKQVHLCPAASPTHTSTRHTCLVFLLFQSHTQECSGTQSPRVRGHKIPVGSRDNLDARGQTQIRHVQDKGSTQYTISLTQTCLPCSEGGRLAILILFMLPKKPLNFI